MPHKARRNRERRHAAGHATVSFLLGAGSDLRYKHTMCANRERQHAAYSWTEPGAAARRGSMPQTR